MTNRDNIPDCPTTFPANDDYYKIISSTGVGYAVANFSRDCMLRLVDYPEYPLRANPCITIKQGNTALLVRTELPIAGRMTAVAYKRVCRKNWWKKLASFFRPNRTLHSWTVGHELLRHGITTPRPLAVVTPHRIRAMQESYLAVAWVDNSQNLYTFGEELRNCDTQQRGRLLKQAAVSLGALVGKLHAAHFSHRDLKGGNLLVGITAKGIESHIIDLDGVDQNAQLSNYRKQWNLSRLEESIRRFEFVSYTDRVRFLKAWLAENSMQPEQWKSLWRTIRQMANSRTERKQNRAA